jgi:hypothetical protein
MRDEFNGDVRMSGTEQKDGRPGVGSALQRALLRLRPGIGTRLVLTTLMLVAAQVTYASQITIPHVFVNGTVADAYEVNENFSALVTESNAQDLRIGSGLSIQVATSEGLANAGGTSNAFLLVAVNSGSGPVTGLIESDFSLTTATAPPGGSLLTITTVTSPGDGLYTIRVVPVVNTWLNGRYLLGVRASAPDGDAVGSSALDIIP